MRATIPQVTGKEGSNDFTSRLFTVIKDGGNDVYGIRDGSDKATNTKTLGNLSGDTPISLGPIAAGASRNYNWTVYFDTGSGNTYQEASTTFDLSLTFVCGNPATPSPGTTSGASAPSPCTDTPPGGAPVLKGITLGINSATLSWTEASGPISYYLIAYGTGHGVYQYGNPGIGGKGTTSYIITNLSGGTIYYFVVRAGNGCAPGPFSNELSANVGGGVLTGPAAGFIPGVLGTSTQSETTPSATKQVLGTECVKNKFPWWVFLALEVVTSLLILRRGKINKWKARRIIFLLIVLVIFSQITHEVTGCNCITSVWCSKYLLINLVITLLSVTYSLYHPRRKKGSPV